jgi:hypothetical protein
VPEDLHSWKQIAAHLGVNVRTAQKWERERGLPVRRGPGGKVAVDVAALESWKHAPLQESSELWFRWPVAPDIFADVRFSGGPITSAHIERLREYLALAKTALEQQ